MKQRADPMSKQAKIALFLTATILASVLVGITSYQTGYSDGAKDAYNPINLEANAVQFNSSELQRFEIIKNRVYLYNSDPAFNGDRSLQWISMRNSTSHDYYQKSMEYLCFWSGQEANGE